MGLLRNAQVLQYGHLLDCLWQEHARDSFQAGDNARATKGQILKNHPHDGDLGQVTRQQAL